MIWHAGVPMKLSAPYTFLVLRRAKRRIYHSPCPYIPQHQTSPLNDRVNRRPDLSPSLQSLLFNPEDAFLHIIVLCDPRCPKPYLGGAVLGCHVDEANVESYVEGVTHVVERAVLRGSGQREMYT